MSISGLTWARGETYLAELEQDRQKIQSGEFEWKEMVEDIDKFVSWCLTARDNYETASYEEKRRALRILGLVVFVYREKDETHERYEIKLKVPYIARSISRSICLHG